ncbi:hypothetical protein EX30DRAFT_338956 [Ascodesmis nigricans]|uniref:Nuclear rim protein 1 n=1 Tax=Ascodesmis nigricans TaxID=341454 RepID=A0A4S2N583_9PEZI|nr:hypothetical protein EX30DRAFT_338956 [Ascodesmis nigricans]
MPRVVRRAPLFQRILSHLNPFDYFLSISTDIDSYDWDALQLALGDPLGIGLNILAAVARANANAFRGRYEDDVFSSGYSRSASWAGGISYLLRLVSWMIVALSIGNAFYAMTRKRRYRLFESNIEVEPATPHARRVRVDSSPSDFNSPVAIFKSMKETLTNDPASRAHPDEARDVWEVSVWDPTPLSLALLAYLSPVHIAVYFLSFPITPTYTYTASGVSSSSTILTVLATQILLTIMLRWLQTAFTQQAKDLRIIHREVLHEYDTKFVQPRVNIRKRDVAIQCTESSDFRGPGVEAFTPALDRQGFRIAPNPNYAPLTWESGSMGPSDRIPPDSVRRSSDYGFGAWGTGGGRSSTARSSIADEKPLMKRMRQPQFKPAPTTTASSDTDRYFSTPAVSTPLPENPGNRRMTSSFTSTTSTATGTGDEGDDNDFSSTTPHLLSRRKSTASSSRDENRKPSSSSTSVSTTRGRPSTTTTKNPATVGINGMVNWSREQSRGLSPSKAQSPLKGARGVRASTYGESLGTPLGTPVRRRYY